MNQEKFLKFSKAYREGLEEAVKANPQNYFTKGETPAYYAEVVSERMLKAISSGGHMGVQYSGSDGFKRACKTLGIKHTRKAILEYLEIA